MTTKILLVSANCLKTPYPVYPLGISYIKTFLQKKLPLIEIRTFDFIENNYDEYVNVLLEFKPKYIGISLRNIDDVNIYNQYSFIEHYECIVKKSKETVNSKIIIGGAGFSIFPELLFSKLSPDFGIYGEGEESLYSLIYALENNSDYSDINGLIFQNSEKIIFNKRIKSLKNPDLIFENDWVNYYWKNSLMLNIQTKRGCPYKCIYCTYPLIEGNNVRTLNIEKIVETLADLSKKKMDYVFFTDSVFNINPNFNIELAKRIISEKIDIKWGAYFNFCNIDENLLSLYKKAGLQHIEFGTESLCDTILESYKKPFRIKEILEISKICVKLDIDFANFLILGGYGETEDTINETFENCKKIEKTVFFPFIGMRIYPGTELHKLALEENKIEITNDLLKPQYYVSDNVDISTLKERASKTGRRWVFPDDDHSKIMNKMRLKNKKGPLWEYLIS